MAYVICKDNIVFGIPPEQRPLKGFPDGKIRVRYRPEDFAIATVRNSFGTAQFYIKDEDGFFQPSYTKAVNATVQ